MIKTDGSIITQEEDNFTEDDMFVYSEEEKQLQEINSANAKLIFRPEFIHYYPEIAEQFNLSYLETLLYGFIRYYKANSKGRFYFTNEQLAIIFRCGSDSIKKSLSKLKENGLIETSQKIKSGGGTVRFVTKVFRPVKNYQSDREKITSRDEATTGKFLHPNKNYLKKNYLKEKIFSTTEGNPLEERLLLRKQKKAKKSKSSFKSNYSYIPVEGDPGKVIPPSLPEKLDQQDAFDIAFEYKVDTGEVKAIYKSILLSVETGNKYKISSGNYLGELKKWVSNAISKGNIQVLTNDLDIETYILDWSPEAIRERIFKNGRLLELGLWDEKTFRENTGPLEKLL